MDPRIAKSLHRALSAALLLAFVAACGGGDEEEKPSAEFILRGEGIVKDPTKSANYLLDFGEVLVGSRTSFEISMVNTGKGSVTIQVGRDILESSPYSVSSGAAQLDPGKSRPLDITFAPQEEGNAEVILSFTAGKKTQKLRLVGVAKALDCNPSEVDFGHVLTGEKVSETVTCKNDLAVPISLRLGNFVEATRPAFTATFADGGNTADLEPGDEVEIEIEFNTGNESGLVTARLLILDGQGNETTQVSVRGNSLRENLQILVEENGDKVRLQGCKQYADTSLERSALETFYLHNFGQQTMEITSLEIDGQGGHFSIESPEFEGSLSVEPGQEIPVVIRYAPLSSEDHRASLMVTSRPAAGGASEELEGCLRGSSAFPSLVCTAPVEFGPVALGTTVTQTSECTVAMVAPPTGTPPSPIKIMNAISEDSQFSAEIRDLDPEGYAPGDSFFLDVRFSPSAEGEHTAAIVLENSSKGASELPIPVLGEGRNLPACSFELGPQVMDFGMVDVGDQRRLTAYVVNESAANECIISNLRAGVDSDSAFFVEPVPTVILPPITAGSSDHRHPVRVTFAPSEARDYEGSVELFISNPANTEQSIVLKGTGGTSCVVLDMEIEDFGPSKPQCVSKATRLSIANFCEGEVTISDITIDGVYSQFTLGGLPALPLDLEEGERQEFEITFRPDTEAGFEGAVVVSFDLDGSSGSVSAPLSGNGETERTDVFGAPKADILWVVGNSATGAQAQAALVARSAFFLSGVDEGADYQIGITPAGTDYLFSHCSASTGFPEPEDGRLVPHPESGLPRIIDSQMALNDQLDAFKRNLEVGSCTESEAVYEAARRALSAPWIHTDVSQGGNKGFMRPDASLAIIGVTVDTDAASFWDGNSGEDHSVSRYVEYFRNRKPSWLQDSVKIHMFSGGQDGCSGTIGTAQACPRCEEGPALTGGESITICRDAANEWDQPLRDLSAAILERDLEYVLHAQAGDRNGDSFIDDRDFEVRVDGRLLQAGSGQNVRWVYDEAKNAIVFTPAHAPAIGELVEINYVADCP